MGAVKGFGLYSLSYSIISHTLVFKTKKKKKKGTEKERRRKRNREGNNLTGNVMLINSMSSSWCF